METRNGLVAGGSVTPASGTGGGRRITLGPDKGYDVAAFVEELRDRKVTPHTAVRDHTTITRHTPTRMRRKRQLAL